MSLRWLASYAQDGQDLASGPDKPRMGRLDGPKEGQLDKPGN